MLANDYQKIAMKTEADQEAIANRIKLMHPEELVMYVELNNGITGLTDEVGELNAALKKWIEYGQPLDEVNLKEEVGDCIWRLSQICKSVDLTLEECMEANIEKLQNKKTGRYKDGYSDEAAKEESRDREEEAKLIIESVAFDGNRVVRVEKARELIKEQSGRECRRLPEIGSPLPLSEYHKDLKITKEVLEQNGNGWGEPPEESEVHIGVDFAYGDSWSEEVIVPNQSFTTEMDTLEARGYTKGLAFGAQIAKEAADLMDGRERKEALKMIEARVENAQADSLATS